MKICAACCEELAQESFSNKQWQMKRYERRCKECIAADRDVQLEAPPKIDESADTQNRPPPSEIIIDDSDKWCCICFEKGRDISGKPLRRGDCSCRGDAGLVHLSCILDHAIEKTEQWDGYELGEFRKIWRECPKCKGEYRNNELAIDLANEAVAFVEERYPGDKWMQIQTLYVKLGTILFTGAYHEETKQIEAKKIGNEILSIIDQMKKETTLSNAVVQIQIDAYSSLGIVAFNQGTRDGAKEAIGYFEISRDISKEAGYAEGVMIAESNIGNARYKYEGSIDVNKEKIEKFRALYEQSVSRRGQEDVRTIRTGVNLALQLRQGRHCIEAERLLAKLAAISERVHGPDHRLSTDIEEKLPHFQLRIIMMRYKQEWETFQPLRYEQDGKTCVVQGPLKDPRNPQEEELLTVSIEDMVLLVGTPVICHGLEGSLDHLNGKIGDIRACDGDTGCCEIHFEDEDLGVSFVKPENLQVQFVLPDLPDE